MHFMYKRSELLAHIQNTKSQYNLPDFEKSITSYARLIKPKKESAGKSKPGRNRKMGNVYLKWAFSEATLLLIREKQEIKEYHLKLKNKHGKARALAIISHKLGRAVYFMLKNQQAFDMNKFLHQ